MNPIASTPTQAAVATAPPQKEPGSAAVAGQQRADISTETINTLLFFVLLVPLVIGWLVVQIRQ
jgi:hypothetical protein